MGPTHRNDIDGLRAIAIAAVVLYHMGLGGMSGGFVGVDIFFVISGYLITGILLREMDGGTFRFQSFWLRRVRRIFPALFATMLATLTAFYFIAPPTEFRHLGQSVFAQTFFSANFLFWLQTGYFDTAAETKPLMHTWSLAVEEQFYLFFPILLWLISRYAPRGRLPFLAGIAVSSLVASIVASHDAPSAAFYLLPTRAWELAVGSLIALAIHTPQQQKANSPFANETIALIGMAAILVSVTFFDRSIPFPSFYAALPVLGAAAVIWANRNQITITGRFLSWPPLVFLGLISYSLYLWHWPVLVFFRMTSLSLNPLDTADRLLAAGISLGLATASYYIIESPVRRNLAIFTPQRLVIGSLIIMTLSAGAGLYIHKANGMLNRFPPEIVRAYETASQKSPRMDTCMWSQTNKAFTPENFCTPTGQPDPRKPMIVIWGDSHLDASQPILDQIGKDLHVPTALASYSGCPAVTNLEQTGAPPGHKCREFNEFIVDYVARNRIPAVLLIARWNCYTEGFDEIYSPGKEPFIRNDPAQKISTKESAERAMTKEFTHMVKRLRKAGTKVYVLIQTPSFRVDPAEMMITSQMLGKPFDLKRPRAEIETQQKFFRTLLSSLDVVVLDPTNIFCGPESCSPFVHGKLAYRDDDHISFYGANLLRPLLEQPFRESLKRMRR